VFFLHFSGIFPVTYLIDNYGNMMLTSMISGDVVAVIIYFWGIVSKKQIRMSGNIFYDIFMGSALNPRIGILDLKLFA
jgi:delta24(24(1))-sterol reductase